MSDPAITIPLFGPVPLKYLSMVCLTLQNCGTTILMRVTRVSDGPQYSAGWSMNEYVNTCVSV